MSLFGNSPAAAPSSTPPQNSTSLFNSPSAVNAGLAASRVASIGTNHEPIVPYTESSDEYQCISAQDAYSNFSREELRLVDYQQGRGGERDAKSAQKLAFDFNTPVFRKSASLARRCREHLDLLRGAAIRVCIGPVACTCSDLRSDKCNCTDSWYLPKALISHYSPFLRAACTRDFKERKENLIELPDDQPEVFAMYVEWLYHGGYTIPTPLLFSANPENLTSMDARCWIMGDKFLDVDFKNYAMSRLYRQYTAPGLLKRAITTHEVGFVLDNTTSGSPLRQLHLHIAVQYFADPTRTKDAIETWDELLLKHSDLRLLLLQSLRLPGGQQKLVQVEGHYMDREETPTMPMRMLELK